MEREKLCARRCEDALRSVADARIELARASVLAEKLEARRNVEDSFLAALSCRNAARELRRHLSLQLERERSKLLRNKGSKHRLLRENRRIARGLGKCGESTLVAKEYKSASRTEDDDDGDLFWQHEENGRRGFDAAEVFSTLRTRRHVDAFLRMHLLTQGNAPSACLARRAWLRVAPDLARKVMPLLPQTPTSTQQSVTATAVDMDKDYSSRRSSLLSRAGDDDEDDSSLF